MKISHLCFFLLAVAAPLNLRAELLVYEGFDPADSSADIQAGQLAGATSKGFAADSKWEVLGSDDFLAEFTSDGLAMPGLASVGGAAKIGVGGAGQAMVNAFRKSGVSVAPGSTIYGSFLFQNDQAESRYLTFLGVDTGEELPGDKGNTREAHRLSDNDTAMVLCLSPDSFARDEEGVPGRSTQGIKVGKYPTFGSKDMAGADYELANGETYLVVWSVTNTAGSGAPASQQQVVMWILSADNLKAIRDAGEASEMAVDSNSLVRLVVPNGLRARLLDSDFINLSASLAGGHKRSMSTYDEIRIGSDMASVLPVP
jgi:hypothetical protein